MTIVRGRICSIYRSSRKAELYVYMDKKASPEALPEPLLKQLGRLVPVMTLHITPERKLARAKAAEVLEGIDKNGYYLQMPPVMDPGVFTHGG